jgi:flagellar FliL protein
MKKIALIAGAAVLLLVIIGVLLFFFVFRDSGPTPVTYFEYNLGEMYSNIADEGKILKMEPTIEYTSEAALVEIEANKTRIVNNIYEIIRNAKYENLQRPNGQERLREDIREMIIDTLESDAETISNVYFLQFIIQG